MRPFVRYLFRTQAPDGTFSLLCMDDVTGAAAMEIAEEEYQKHGPVVVTRASRATGKVETSLVGFEPRFCSQERCEPVCNHCARYQFQARRCELRDEAREPDSGAGCDGFVCRLAGREKPSAS